MPQPVTTLKNDPASYVSLACPLTRLEVTEEFEDTRYELVPCGGDLHLVRESYHDLLVGTEQSELDPGGAQYATWKVECENGHVLLTSYDDGSSVSPFVLDDLRDILSAGPVVTPA